MTTYKTINFFENLIRYIPYSPISMQLNIFKVKNPSQFWKLKYEKLKNNLYKCVWGKGKKK